MLAKNDAANAKKKLEAERMQNKRDLAKASAVAAAASQDMDLDEGGDDYVEGTIVIFGILYQLPCTSIAS